MSLDHISAVFAAHIPNPTDKLVALAVADYANRETGKAWPSLAALQSMTSLCERAVRNSLRRLEAEGHLTCQKGEGRSHTSCYWLHPKGASGAPIQVQNPAPDAPIPPQNPAPNAPFSPGKGAPDAGLQDQKGASGAEKGASGSIKGAPNAPEPVITVKNQKSTPSKPAARATLDEVLTFTKSIGLPDSDGEACFWKWEANGWTNSNKPIKDWKATIRSWRAAGFFPSQKSNSPSSGTGQAAAKKKEARPPEELGRLMAIHRGQYPQSRAERWQDLPADIRHEAEAALTAEKKTAQTTLELT